MVACRLSRCSGPLFGAVLPHRPCELSRATLSIFSVSLPSPGQVGQFSPPDFSKL